MLISTDQHTYKISLKWMDSSRDINIKLEVRRDVFISNICWFEVDKFKSDHLQMYNIFLKS